MSFFDTVMDVLSLGGEASSQGRSAQTAYDALPADGEALSRTDGSSTVTGLGSILTAGSKALTAVGGYLAPGLNLGTSLGFGGGGAASLPLTHLVGAAQMNGTLGGVLATAAGSVAAAGASGLAAGYAMDHGVGFISRLVGGDGRSLSDRIGDSLYEGGRGVSTPLRTERGFHPAPVTPDATAPAPGAQT